MTRYEVRCSDDFLLMAKAAYPVGGTSSGKPRFADFEDGPLKAVKTQFSRQFDTMPAAIEEPVAIKFALTSDVRLFPPMVFYAILVGDAVEIISFSVDPGYHDLIDADPDDI